MSLIAEPGTTDGRTGHRDVCPRLLHMGINDDSQESLTHGLAPTTASVSYTHLRAHETSAHL
eukprot:9482777-Alexandrium_andersonii.AAC.1